MSLLSSLTRFYPSQRALHERLPSSTSWRSWFSVLIAPFSIDCPCSPPWLLNCTFLIWHIRNWSRFSMVFPMFRLVTFSFPLLCVEGLTKRCPGPCLSAFVWVMTAAVGATGSCSALSSGRSLPVSVEDLGLKDSSESAVCTDKTECLVKAGILLSSKN